MDEPGVSGNDPMQALVLAAVCPQCRAQAGWPCWNWRYAERRLVPHEDRVVPVAAAYQRGFLEALAAMTDGQMMVDTPKIGEADPPRQQNSRPTGLGYGGSITPASFPQP